MEYCVLACGVACVFKPADTVAGLLQPRPWSVRPARVAVSLLFVGRKEAASMPAQTCQCHGPLPKVKTRQGKATPPLVK